MGMPKFISQLKSCFQDPLPGLEAQKKMALSHHRYPASWKREEDAISAAVLILLFPRKGEWSFVLTERSNQVEYHQGQVSLPGGAREKGETLQQTALRETQEELGLDTNEVTILGELTPLFIPVSGFLVHPFVGWMDREPKLTPDPTEVESAHVVSLQQLLDESNIKEETWRLLDEEVRVPFFHLGNLKVWGATARILSEFREIIKRAGEKVLDP